jgi:hypothetical protein
MVTAQETGKKALFLNQGTFLKPPDRPEQRSGLSGRRLLATLLGPCAMSVSAPLFEDK